MNSGWIPCDRYLPDREGTYLVTTANGAIILDRFIDGAWARCTPTVKGKGRYKPHLAWRHLPHPAKF